MSASNSSLNVGSDGMGSWAFDFLEPFLKRTFPKTNITFDNTTPPDLVILSHFKNLETAPPYACPYIVWSGESQMVPLLEDHQPLFELNNFYCSRPNSVYFPYLFVEVRETARPPSHAIAKKYCCAYANSNPIFEREFLFWRMRTLEPTCYAFGSCSFTPDNPFDAPAGKRKENNHFFTDFGFTVAMENAIVPGYLTEKIGFAFCAGTVPIYCGDTEIVNTFFNPASFLNVRDYVSVPAAAEYAVHIWQDKHKLQKMLDAPIRVSNHLAEYEAIYTECRPWQIPMVDALRTEFPDLS